MLEYPVILYTSDRMLVTYAREYKVLPMTVEPKQLFAALPEQCGTLRPGLYVLNGKTWSYLLPYSELNVSKFVDKIIEVYCNISLEKNLDPEFIGTVYMNGGERAERTIPSGDSKFWAVTSLRANSTGSGGSTYVLPRATATVLGGIQVIQNSGLELYNGFLSVIKPDPSYQVHLPAQTTLQEAAGGVRYEWLIDVGAARLSDLSRCRFTVKTAPTIEVTFAVMKNNVPVCVLVFAPGSTVGTEIPNSATPATFFQNDVLSFWQNGSTQRMDAMNVLIVMERLG